METLRAMGRYFNLASEKMLEDRKKIDPAESQAGAELVDIMGN